jgi:hypothetical protein
VWGRERIVPSSLYTIKGLTRAHQAFAAARPLLLRANPAAQTSKLLQKILRAISGLQ